jgi:hypothetical protein
MLEHDTLRKTLYSEAIAAVTALSLQCRIGDEAFVPPTDGSLYGEFWFRTGKSRQMELGPATGYECTSGILQFTLYAPEKNGDGAILRLGGQLKHRFNRKQFQVAPDGYVTLETVAVETIPGVKNGHKVVIVDAAFDFYHRNPDAT